MEIPSELTLRALRLAENDCLGEYGLEEIEELKRLAAQGMVINVKTGTGAFYRLAPEGKAVLDKARG